jgi:hypothetical protein
MYPAIIAFLGYEPWSEPKTVPEALLAERRRRGLSIKRAAQAIRHRRGNLGFGRGAALVAATKAH